MRLSINNLSLTKLLNLLFLVLAFSIVSCDDNDDGDDMEPMSTIADVVSDDDRFSTLLAALEEADLVSTFSGTASYTVFAPTDEAFQAYLDANDLTAEELLSSDALAEILQYHVVSGEVTSTSLSNGGVETLLGEDIYVNINSGVVINGVATVTEADVSTSNGVIHVIDNVLEPAAGTITEIAAANDNFSTLVSLLQEYGLDEALNGDGPYTVFAPTNEAFEKISEVIPTLSDAEIEDILKFHVIPARAFSSDLASQDYGTLNTRKDLNVDLSSGIVINGTEEVDSANANINATNGVIHVIDDVLLPERTVVDVALYNPEFSLLVEALTKADLVETLDEAENLTVFAPTNTALEAALGELGFSSLDEVPVAALVPILTYHVIGGEAPFLSTDLKDETYYTTLNGAAIKFDADILSLIDANDQEIPLNADLLDLEESNGVVHVINGVLLPPSETVVDIAVAQDPEFTTLVSLLERVGLDTTLASLESKFTVFAPTNQAFEDLGVDPETLTDEQLTNILLYHVVDGRVYSSDLMEGEVSTLLTDATFTVNINGSVSITDNSETTTENATVVTTDIQGTNGVIHIIDKVILPE
ncbi:fasciclin domain-containing protein [Chondrinema litorale]|uniref:fasciclin domain-containing protein n=1 Tax=Chondrinema litorale TaxID=2994555 RepID=UPI00254315EF|nr:fasciclin domain-containing protein [Chondrinema litorale]UZR96437.1 fasciclin domain-containing protein [Chondrinema litorale]